MKYYYVRKILDSEQLKVVYGVIEEANKNNYWNDGLNSLKGNDSCKRIKNNLELSNLHLSQVVNNLIMSSLDSDKKFIDFVVAKSTTLNIISKTSSGGYYNPHLDNWYNGDYSTTVFLNDPREYDGGELCLYCGGEDEIKIKLKSGWGVTYSTGIVHRVNKVASGNRYVSVFWTESLIKDPFIRHLYSEIGNIRNNISLDEYSIHLSNCKSVESDPQFCLDNLKTQILRRYASK